MKLGNLILKTLLNSVPSSLLTNISKRKALKTFEKSKANLTSYYDFLKAENFEEEVSINNFEILPITDKHNYILPSNLEDRMLSSIPLFYYKSSGYSGEPVYWTQSNKDYKYFLKYLGVNLDYVFDIYNKKTLLISMFAMSSWITGQQTSAALFDFAKDHENITLFNCGMNAEEPLEIIGKFGENYDQIIMFSYPLTFKELVDNAKDKNIDLSKYNIKVIVGAEGVTWNWSNYYNKILSSKGKPEYRIFSGFGAADTGIGISAEHVTGLIIKDIINKNSKIRKEITNLSEMPLHLFQYNPLNIYLESPNNELIVTVDKQIPLIRYNLHDRAVVIEFDKINSILKSYGYDLEELVKSENATFMKLPFMIIYGRSDDTLILNGANIYMNSFKEALSDSELINYHTGRFKVVKIENKDLSHDFKVEVELQNDVKETKKLKELFRNKIIDFLSKKDKGYKFAFHDKYFTEKSCQIEFVKFNHIKLKHNYKS